ncbi:hypothetical protein FHW92_003698 [Novosphingobium sp. SG707]|nr:hypothetical protein [Novosphingobium sp. SG707]
MFLSPKHHTAGLIGRHWHFTGRMDGMTEHQRNCIFYQKSYTLCMTFSEREMQCFVAVAETGSLGRAAAHVHLAQPSLSRLVQRMEAQSGQPLFSVVAAREARSF